MASTYSPLKFLRLVSNRLLARYFEKRGIALKIDWASLTETNVEPIRQAYQALGDDVYHEIEADFRSVWAAANKKATLLFFDELKLSEQHIPEFRKKNGYFDKSLWVFTEHRKVFDYVSLFPTQTTGQYWKRLFCPLISQIYTDAATLERLSQAIRALFNEEEGRGAHCTVEHYFFRGLHYFFAYPSDHSQTAIEWQKDNFERRSYLPAFEIIFVAAEESDVVEIFHEGQRKTASALLRLWVEHVLQIPDWVDDSRLTYVLDTFHNGAADIVIPPDSRVSRLDVHKLRFNPTQRPDTGVEFDRGQSDDDVFDMLKENLYDIGFLKLVGIDAYLRRTDGTGETRRRFNLSARSCQLGHEGDDAEIRTVLKLNGIQLGN